MSHCFSSPARLIIALCTLCSGCVAIGTGHCGGCLSIANEIQELREARDDGKISLDEFHMGMAALQNRNQ